MSFPQGSRVVLLKTYLGIPSGSLGTVDSGDDVTSNVDFDVDPTRTVFVPNRILRSAHARLKEARQAASSAPRGKSAAAFDAGEKALKWYPPHVVTPGTGNESTFAAVTATPNLLSLLFQGAEVALRGAVTSGCWIGSLDFPVSGGPAKLEIDARGFVDQPDGARSSVTVVIGGEAYTLRFDAQHSGEVTKSFRAEIGREPSQTITVIILSERPAGSDDVLVVIDSLDVIVA